VSYIPTPQDTGGGGNDATVTTPTVYDTSKYSKVAPALSSQQLGALGERRRVAENEYQRTLASVARNEAIYQSDSQRNRQNELELSGRYIRDSTRELAGKGVARSPMFAGRMIRAANQDLQMKWGEIDSRLGVELSSLKSMVDDAMSRRATEIASIRQEEANMRANLDAIFAASSMY
jgi:hypothetical protein